MVYQRFFGKPYRDNAIWGASWRDRPPRYTFRLYRYGQYYALPKIQPDDISLGSSVFFNPCDNYFVYLQQWTTPEIVRVRYGKLPMSVSYLQDVLLHTDERPTVKKRMVGAWRNWIRLRRSHAALFEEMADSLPSKPGEAGDAILAMSKVFLRITTEEPSHDEVDVWFVKDGRPEVETLERTARVEETPDVASAIWTYIKELGVEPTEM